MLADTRLLRSLGVISELPLSSRDVVTTLGAPLGRMLLEEPVLTRLVVFATCCGSRRLIFALTTAKLNPPALEVAFYGLFGIFELF